MTRGIHLTEPGAGLEQAYGQTLAHPLVQLQSLSLPSAQAHRQHCVRTSVSIRLSVLVAVFVLSRTVLRAGPSSGRLCFLDQEMAFQNSGRKVSNPHRLFGTIPTPSCAIIQFQSPAEGRLCDSGQERNVRARKDLGS